MKIATVIVFVILVMCSAIQTLASIPENPPAASVGEARSLLRESFDLRMEKKLDEAEVLIKRVIAFDPKFRAEYPDEKISLHAMASLADIYYEKGDWQKALHTYELAERNLQERYPDSDSILPIKMARCREKLAELGALDTQSAMITVGGSLLLGGGTIRNGITLVPVSKLAELLNLETKVEGESTRLSSKEQGQRTLTLTFGSNKALADRTSITLPVAPSNDGAAMLVPLRAVAEYFGAQVVWEPLPRIARVY